MKRSAILFALVFLSKGIFAGPCCSKDKKEHPTAVELMVPSSPTQTLENNEAILAAAATTQASLEKKRQREQDLRSPARIERAKQHREKVSTQEPSTQFQPTLPAAAEVDYESGEDIAQNSARDAFLPIGGSTNLGQRWMESIDAWEPPIEQPFPYPARTKRKPHKVQKWRLVPRAPHDEEGNPVNHLQAPTHTTVDPQKQFDDFFDTKESGLPAKTSERRRAALLAAARRNAKQNKEQVHRFAEQPGPELLGAFPPGIQQSALTRHTPVRGKAPYPREKRLNLKERLVIHGVGSHGRNHFETYGTPTPSFDF